MPADVEPVGVAEGIARAQAAAGRLDRPFSNAYSGSGLLIMCCGRLKAMPPSHKRRQTLTFSTTSAPPIPAKTPEVKVL